MSKRCMGCMELYGNEFEICPHCGYVEGTAAEETIHMEPGTLLHDRYIIGKVLGFGGFGITYIGWDGKLEQKVAVKEYLPGEFSTRMPGQSSVTVFNGEKSEQFYDGMKKFIDEAKRLAKFHNESGIVKVFDSFAENGTAYIIMEYLDGETLTERLAREGTIPEEEAVQMLLPVMNSLQVVHGEGILHRDIAPDNIFLTKSGEVKLIDFGASRYATTSHSRSLTVIIKPGYSPEEQYRSRGDQGPYTDVYALAATLYKMITGKTPPDAMERRAKIENQKKETLIEPHKLNKNISINRENAILNAMNVRIEDRTPDVRTFMEELNADPPVKRRYGKIKKIDVYAWPLWLKIALPSLLAVLLIVGILLLTGVIRFPSLFSDEVVVPEGLVAVPDVEGMNREDATRLIEGKKLHWQSAGNVESPYVPAGKIVLQSPVGGSYLEEYGTVLLTVSRGTGQVEIEDGMITLTDLLGMTQEEAAEKLKEWGLAEPILEYSYSENYPAGQICGQNPAPGEKVKVGEQITLTVSQGPAPFDMPDVVGKTYEEASLILKEKGLSPEPEYVISDSAPEGQVLGQSVSAGEKVKRGDKVTLTVSSARPRVAVKDVVGKTQEEAKAILEEQGFTVTFNSVYDNTIEAGRVIRQNPEAGREVLPGETTVTLDVSKGKQPTPETSAPETSAPETSAPETSAPAPVTVTVTFEANGGTVGKKSASYNASGVYSSLPTPTRNGYSFSGWYTARSGGSKVVNGSKIVSSSNHTLYAIWKANSYTVTLNANGGSGVPTSVSVTFDSTYGSLPTPTKTGYKFLGWYTSLSGGSLISSGTKVSTASAHTLYAQWSVISYTLSYNANGGSVSPSSKSVNYGGTYGSLPTPKWDYHHFEGWYTASTGGSLVSSSTKMGAGNTTIYAHWTLNPLSDWVLESQVPSGGKIEEEKWTYTQETESSESSMSGWSQTGSYWKETGHGSTNYASFPSGFDKNHSIYKNFSQSAYSAYENASSKRVVSNSWAGYVYWHWMYDCGRSAGSPTRAIYDREGRGPDTGYQYKYFYAFTSSKGDYASDKLYCNSLLMTNYIIPDDHTSYEECGGSTRWFRFDYYVSEYTDYIMMYKYRRTAESGTKVTEGGEISNVQHYVKYRLK